MLEEGPPTTTRAALGEFPSEVVQRFGETRAAMREKRDLRPVRLHEDAIDRELLHRLHGDMRKGLEEMRATQAATLAALAQLQTTLIRWIVFTGIVAVVLVKLLSLWLV